VADAAGLGDTFQNTASGFVGAVSVRLQQRSGSKNIAEEKNMLNDSLANALSVVMNYERASKREVLLHPISRLLRRVLALMQDHGYVGALEELSEGRGGFAKLNLLGTINACGAIKPRFAVSYHEYEKFEKRYLPANGVGVLIVSTPKGILTHKDAREQKLGGRLIAYCY
jgi:small subunit ribosomal protein S8